MVDDILTHSNIPELLAKEYYKLTSCTRAHNTSAFTSYHISFIESTQTATQTASNINQIWLDNYGKKFFEVQVAILNLPHLYIESLLYFEII